MLLSFVLRKQMGITVGLTHIPNDINYEGSKLYRHPISRSTFDDTDAPFKRLVRPLRNSDFERGLPITSKANESFTYLDLIHTSDKITMLGFVSEGR